MDTVNGEWIMKGCRRTDRDCLHTPDDLLKMIREVGFLPLFSNDIPGFSVEEHTCAEDWWVDDPARDPWAWRQALAPNDGAAYGKFFDKKAGFVSKEWFPVFANYRRDGYDYEGLYEDGKLNSRGKRILDIFGLNENAEGTGFLSFEIKRRAALEKGFEGALTDLQMKTFLIMSDFRQRRNKYGEAYGWHVAELMTPESKWGYDVVNSCGENRMNPGAGSSNRSGSTGRRLQTQSSGRSSGSDSRPNGSVGKMIYGTIERLPFEGAVFKRHITVRCMPFGD